MDVSNPEKSKHIEVTNGVLKNLGCKSPVIMVYNKCDKISQDQLEEIKLSSPDSVFISAKSNMGIDELKQKIEKKF